MDEARNREFSKPSFFDCTASVWNVKTAKLGLLDMTLHLELDLVQSDLTYTHTSVVDESVDK